MNSALKYSKENNKAIISNALSKAGLSIYKKKRIYQLSEGEPLRVAIAMVIIKP